MKKYYSMTKMGNSASINIYGDITSYPICESDVTANSLSRQLEQLTDVAEINVYINSYGGEVAEGLAIYNALKRHYAKVKTYCDGFACSIASVIFMAGDERIMNDASLLMIHNAWNIVQGNAQELRKQADDLDKISQAALIAYKAHSTLTEDEIKNLMDNESWILPEEAKEYGFATAIETSNTERASQSAKMRLLDIIPKHRAEVEEQDEEIDEDDDETVETDDETVEEPEEAQEEETEEEQEPEEENSDDEEESDEEPTEEPTQKWSGFFNALKKM